MTNFDTNFHKLYVLVLCLFFVVTGSVSTALADTASSTTAEPVQKPIHVLIVPGHEPNYGGAIFNGLKERNLTVALATDLQQLLAQDPHFQVTMTRNPQGWNPIFSDYFINNWTDIISWEKLAKKTFTSLIAQKVIKKPVSKINPHTAAVNVANRLYGINKWANENNIDITISIHFDDEGSHRYNVPGRYSGFMIYEPVPQYDNYGRSREVAMAVVNRLKELSPVSNLHKQSNGIIDEPDLIAVGEYNTSNVANLLIEYGFIYEKKFTDPKLRAKTLEDLALKTYQALDDYRIQKQ